MKLEIIYTFNDRPQQVVTMPISEHILNNKEMFFVYATSPLLKEEKETLVKMSGCIYEASNLNLYKNHWYNKENGKFYDCDIRPLMKKMYDIECTYEPINT